MTPLLDLWATAMWRACWQGGIVVLVVWIVCRLLPSMPARYQCWFWRIAILKFAAVLLLPCLFNIPLLPARVAVVHEVHQPVVEMPDAVEIPVAAEIPISPRDSVQHGPAKTFQWPSLRAVVCFAWGIGVTWLLVRLTVAWCGAMRLRGKGVAIENRALTEHLALQGKAFGLRRLPRLVAVEGDGSPMLVGLFRPAIMIPTETLGRLSLSEQTMVLGHELAHIRRGDLFWGLIASIVRAVFFFHPLAWWSQRQLRLAQEVAADELAIARQCHEPGDYGELLVSIVGKLGSRPLVSPLAAETVGTVHSVARRLVAMTRIGCTSRRVIVGSLFLLGTVVLLGLVPWRLVAAEPKEGEKRPLPPVISEKQAEVVAETEKLGGKIIVGEKSPENAGIAVDLQKTKVTDAGLEHLQELPQLESLNLQGTRVTDAGLKNFKGLAQLQMLNLDGTAVTDAGLVHLRGLSQLQSLNLGTTGVTDAGLKHLEGLTNLRSLNLWGTKVTGVGLEHLKGLTKLESLNLDSTKVTGVGLEHLKGLSHLSTLDLIGTKVTDAGLEHLKGLTQLRSLSLENTEVTDTGLKHLEGLTNLESLDLGFTKVTYNGLEHLKGLSNLKSLNLWVARGGIAGLKHLQGLTNLQCLYLGYSGLTDSGLGYIQELTKLEKLALTQTNVTDKGLEYLQGLTKLQELSLSYTNVTDTGLEHLKRLSQLQTLKLTDTKVTYAGVKNLQQALPQCKIHCDFVLGALSSPAPAWTAAVTPEQAKALTEIEVLGGKVTVEKVRTEP